MDSTAVSTVVDNESVSVNPETLQPNEDFLVKQPWFHGRIPKEEANELLQLDGQFLIRYAKDKTDGVVKTVISVAWGGRHHHFLVREKLGMFSIEESQFESIQSMIDFHVAKRKPLTRKSGALIIEPVLKRSSDGGGRLLIPHILKAVGVVAAVFFLYFSMLIKSIR